VSVPALHTGGARFLRGATLGLACTLLSTAAHTAGGGAAIDAGLLIGLVAATGLGVAWADRRATWTRLAVFVVGCQVLLHVLASLVGSHHPGQSLLPTVSMMLAHVLAATLVALLLTHADAVLHRWAVFLRSLAHPPAFLPQLPFPFQLWVPDAVPASAATRIPALLIARRGPPVLR